MPEEKTCSKRLHPFNRVWLAGVMQRADVRFDSYEHHTLNLELLEVT